MGDDKILSTKEVADLLGLKQSTIYQLVARGKLKPHKICGVNRFFLSEVIQAVKES